MNLKEIEETIGAQSGVLLYFSGASCRVCHALKPKIEELIRSNFPRIEMIVIDAQQYPDIAARYGVFSVPTLILFLEGREFVREGRAVSLHELRRKLERPYRLLHGV